MDLSAPLKSTAHARPPSLDVAMRPDRPSDYGRILRLQITALLQRGRWAEEDHPGRKVVIEIFKPMLDPPGHEEHVPGLECRPLSSAYEGTGPAGNDVDLVARMGLLRVRGAGTIKADVAGGLLEKTGVKGCAR